jgi:hypothetical protein
MLFSLILCATLQSSPDKLDPTVIVGIPKAVYLYSTITVPFLSTILLILPVISLI